MRPLTATRPKPLVEVAGKALIDHVLDRLVQAGVETAVVNVHYLPDQLEAHVLNRQGKPPKSNPDAKVVVSAEALKVWFPITRGFLRKTVGHIKAVDGVDVVVRERQTALRGTAVPRERILDLFGRAETKGAPA